MIHFVLYVNPFPVAAKPMTDAKALVNEFLASQVHHVPGAMIRFSEFRQRLNQWAATKLSPYAISRALPPEHASGVHNQNKSYVINTSWEPKAPDVPLVIIGGRIKRKPQ